MRDLSEGLREFVDGAEPAVRMADIEAVLANRSTHRASRKRHDAGRTTGVLVAAAAVAVAVLIVSVVVAFPPPSAKVTIPANTPVALDVPSTPKLAIRLPSDAIDKYRINWSKVPSYVPLYLGTSLIGYVTKASVEHPPLIAAPDIKLNLPATTPDIRHCILVSPSSPQVVKVFSKSHVLVGWVSPTSGFVRLGDGQSCGQ